MNKKDAYALGMAAALLEAQFDVEITEVRSDDFLNWEINIAFQKGQNTVYGKDHEHYWETKYPIFDGVYRVQVAELAEDETTGPVIARFDIGMGWTKPTYDRAPLDRSTLPFIEGKLPWKTLD